MLEQIGKCLFTKGVFAKMLQDVMEPKGIGQDPRIHKNYYYPSAWTGERKEQLPESEKSMLSREANLKVPAVQGHRLSEVTLKERGRRVTTLTSLLISCGYSSLAKPTWKLENKEEHQCSPFKSAI